MSLQLSSYTLQGMRVLPVEIEVDFRAGLPSFNIIGLASTSVQESKDRVRSAIQSSGFEFPMNRKVVNLAPAELQKNGSHFDLPIAVAFLAQQGLCDDRELHRTLVLGELGLSGELRGVKGILPTFLWAMERGFDRVIFPSAHRPEFALLQPLGFSGEWFCARHLKDVLSILQGERRREFDPSPSSGIPIHPPTEELGVRLEDIVGQRSAKRALQIAAAGGHHLALGGSPGVGKTLLGQALVSLLPPLSLSEQIEVESLHSLLHGDEALNLRTTRPFRSTHPRMTPFAFFGGGTQLTPGEVSLAHRGVLFMDELAEFSREILEGLRGPLEGRPVELRFGKMRCQYPCQFQLVGAYNPCPCGYYGDSMRRCVCSGAELARYRRKLSGPLLDRIDLHLYVPRLSAPALPFSSEAASFPATNSLPPEISTPWPETDRARMEVDGARERQRARGVASNAELSARMVQAFPLELSTQDLLRDTTARLALSARAVHRSLKVARTLADLEGKDAISKVHVQEALMFRLQTA